jgi:hypothetical protein
MLNDMCMYLYLQCSCNNKILYLEKEAYILFPSDQFTLM